ncbi:MAG: peptide-methionine (S)-S-oxide reductase MsrA [Hoeflea sp.]|uniref:peptide-methionine (S)-S-oxide reductase MsrA n=1 Tax=Hoeflea sp. TaxID=1940281 RepID=UPI001DBFD163|nr:peptide-methionine (S)-S-oxide reductase MsrA [Hoeflea sp.]MBU4529860.1 peptide-methionine (S)-S-oxide reductase MsrA [Alphaproteobacteria bacterium]MBU4547119.1 peptide-methionine (S)-S-oxide reductase MsrA [Alphaproteobacteria bacterium]MBU4548732.1 peptide-methionine (S)-S-oxide reductase MsrA [Alphaproteobacteria bacterium]MBV1722353.1 peptide-methionine (S)-S-oxide reductase MsrA [Hoeflea sp.]MBV1762491.1 peptide-methionine (S)-S-oxide reductase MsrA [Hoeflea sp.]
MLRLLLSSAVITLALTAVPARSQDTGVAIFAGGCFWCVESDFDKVEGVSETISGYIGGKADNPTYETHTANGDREAVRITYDPAVVSYAELLKTFFRTVDPTDDGGQFCDRGYSYTTAVYALNDDQAAAAEAARKEAETVLGKTVVTPIEPSATFWPAEDYHQDFYEKSAVRYTYYRRACGRDNAVKALWGDEAFYSIEK